MEVMRMRDRTVSRHPDHVTTVNSMDEEESPLKAGVSAKEPPRYGSLQSPSPATEHRVYPGRFYVLAVFTLVVLLQSFAWMTFGTIPNETYAHFGLTDDDITLIAGIYYV